MIQSYTVEQLDKLNGLVNCAGVLTSFASVTDASNIKILDFFFFFFFFCVFCFSCFCSLCMSGVGNTLQCFVDWK